MNISENAKKLLILVRSTSAIQCNDGAVVGCKFDFSEEKAEECIQQAIDLERNAALEEAAKECDAMKQAALTASPSTSSTQMVFELAAGLRDCAARIRSLKKG